MAATASGKSTTARELEFLYHHVFLPPEVPQSDDFKPELDIILVEFVESGLSTLKDLVDSAQHGLITEAINMLRIMQSIHTHGDIEATQLRKSFANVVTNGKKIVVSILPTN